MSGALVAGIDEVGRGCLAGPVYAAAVVLPSAPRLRGLRDSKKLCAAARERLVPKIEARALSFAIGMASVEEIERHNILQATGIAMLRAVAALSVRPDVLRVDGNWRPPLDGAVELLIGGDDIDPAIMAASILAKVARDAFMASLHPLYPHFGWNRNKGYGTPEHVAALRRHGPCEWHRRSFAPCAQTQFDFGDDLDAACDFDPAEAQ